MECEGLGWYWEGQEGEGERGRELNHLSSELEDRDSYHKDANKAASNQKIQPLLFPARAAAVIPCLQDHGMELPPCLECALLLVSTADSPARSSPTPGSSRLSILWTSRAQTCSCSTGLLKGERTNPAGVESQHFLSDPIHLFLQHLQEVF